MPRSLRGRSPTDSSPLLAVAPAESTHQGASIAAIRRVASGLATVGCAHLRSHPGRRWVGVGLESGDSVPDRGRPRSDRGRPARRRRNRRTAPLHRPGGRRDRFTRRGRTRRRVAGRLHRAARLRAGARPRAGAGERDDPDPGETARDWWAHTGALEAQEEAARVGGYGPFDVATYFLHDVDAEVAAEGEAYQRSEADIVFESVCDFEAWPAIGTRVLAGSDDRFFPVGLQRRVARDRLGVEADVLPGGHLLPLAQPRLVADYLLQTTPPPLTASLRRHIPCDREVVRAGAQPCGSRCH